MKGLRSGRISLCELALVAGRRSHGVLHSQVTEVGVHSVYGFLSCFLRSLDLDLDFFSPTVPDPFAEGVALQ